MFTNTTGQHTQTRTEAKITRQLQHNNEMGNKANQPSATHVYSFKTFVPVKLLNVHIKYI